MELHDLAVQLRPITFNRVFGHTRIVQELITRSKENSWPSALLFSGETGRGKTTLAKITAMAINCKNLHDGEPCGICPSCKSIIEERWDRDTIVLDGGSVGQKQNINDLIKIANVSPMYDSRRVIMIEEADQLSNDAKDALHKALEKPRKSTVFILLSMEKNGLRASLKDRCQIYNLKNFSTVEIAQALKSSMETLGLWEDSSIPNVFKVEGLYAIASYSEGSIRSALQLLEKALVGKYYTKEDISQSIGIIDIASLMELLIALLKRDIKTFFTKIDTTELKSFFDLSYDTISKARIYQLTGISESDYMEETYKALSQFTTLKQLLSLYDEIYEHTSYYLKKAFFMSKMVGWFDSHSVGGYVPTQVVVDTNKETERLRIQAELDARALSRHGDVEVTPLGPKLSQRQTISNPLVRG